MERGRKQFKQARRTKKSEGRGIFLHIFAKNKATFNLIKIKGNYGKLQNATYFPQRVFEREIQECIFEQRRTRGKGVVQGQRQHQRR